MREAVELLLEMYKVQVARTEHFENLRVSVTNVVIGLSTALLALAALDQQMSASDAWVGGAIFGLGLFRYSVNHLHGKRAGRHGDTAAEYRRLLDGLVPDAQLNAVRARVELKRLNAERTHDKRRERTHLNLMWDAIPLILTASGLLIAVLAIGTGN